MLLSELFACFSCTQKPPAINSSQYVVTDSGVKILSMVPLKQTSGSSLVCALEFRQEIYKRKTIFLCFLHLYLLICLLRQALGLSTARGRGRCKNPSCDYVYKNRHKPQYCPSCGCELATKAAKKAKVAVSYCCK